MTDVLKQVEFTVDGQTYVTCQLGAVEGRRLFLDLFKAIAPAIESIPTSDVSKEYQEQAMLAAAARVISQLEGNLLDSLCDTFGPKTRHIVTATQTPNLDKGYFALHFAGRYIPMFKWIFECCKANGFLNFLPGS